MKLVPTAEKVTIKWFVWSCDQKMPRESSMRGTWGYDAECSCGWRTNTGGATRSCIQNEIENHKRFDHDYQMVFRESQSTKDFLTRFNNFLNGVK